MLCWGLAGSRYIRGSVVLMFLVVGGMIVVGINVYFRNNFCMFFFFWVRFFRVDGLVGDFCCFLFLVFSFDIEIFFSG